MRAATATAGLAVALAGAPAKVPAEAYVELPAISVVSTRTELAMAEVPASVSVLSADAFDRFVMQDAGDLVRFEPLVEIPFDLGGTDPFVPYQSPGYSAYSIRGVGGNRVLLQIDGIRQPEIMTGSGGTRTDLFDPLVLSSLEILKGTGSSLYGSDAMAGVISLATRARSGAAAPGGLLRAGYDSASDGRHVLAAGRVGEDAWRARLAHVERRAGERANFGGVPENPETLESRHSLAAVSWSPAPAHALDLTLERFARDQQLDYDSAEGFQPALLLDFTEVSFRTRQERRRASLDYEWRPVRAGIEAVRLLGFHQEAETASRSRQVGTRLDGALGRDRTDAIGFRQAQTGGEFTVTGRLEHGPGTHRWTAGVSLELATSENRFARTDAVPVLRTEDLLGMAPSETLRAALFLQDEWVLGAWRLIAGLRAERYRIQPENTDPYVNRLNERLPPGFPALRAVDYALTSVAPSVALSRRWGEALMTYGRYARGYRQPTAEEFTGLFFHGAEFVILPNPDLVEESSDAWEIGLKWFGERLTLEAALFDTLYEGFFETVSTGERLDPDNPLSLQIQQLRNVGAARVRGFEVAAHYWLLAPGHARGRLRLTAAAGQAWGENRTTDEPLASIAPRKASLALAWESADGVWAADLSAIHRARHHDPPPDALFVPEASTVVELGGSWRLTEDWRLQLRARNLLDEKYHLWSNSNQGIHFPDDPERSTLPGRNLYIAAEWRF